MLNEYVSSCSEVLILKLVRNQSDIEDDSCQFKPTYCHQVFGNREEIMGYKELEIYLYYGACSLTTYLSHDYKEKLMGGENAPEDPLKKIKNILPPGTLSDINEFTRLIRNEYNHSPFGTHLNTFCTSGIRNFKLYTCTAEEKDYCRFHNKLQVFILWYIESGNLIDITDPKWRIFLIYEEYTDNQQRQCHAIVGCTTVYEFYSYPSGIRPRISQVLILPPFQRLGLCSWLLKNIYSFYLAQPNTTEITVEDPSNEFQRVRDYVDCLSCIEAKEFSSESLYAGFKKGMVSCAKKSLITAKQARRVYEILKLKLIDNNEADFKKYKEDLQTHLIDPMEKKHTVIFNKWQKIRKLALAKNTRPNLQISSRKRTTDLMLSELLESHQKVVARLRKKEEEANIHSMENSHS